MKSTDYRHVTPVLTGEQLQLAYPGKTIFTALDLKIPAGQITVIIGPNACGKSTLLRALARLLKPQSGRVLLDGCDIHRLPSREVARRLGLLPQSSTAPAGICVADLVARGRFPHQSLLHQWSRQDELALEQAMAATGISDLAERSVDELSGGQRQRVWLALLLAQQTPVLLLDEPTTYLDVAHQLEVLELCRRLNREEGRTLVLVLHDLNQAARYADYLVAMKGGQVMAAGTPDEVMQEALIKSVFGIHAHILPDPITRRPWVLPIASCNSLHAETDFS